MNRVKYLVLEKGGLERAYVFGELDSHREVAVKLLSPINWDAAAPLSRIKGAGFCHLEVAVASATAYGKTVTWATNKTWKCYGESTTLKVQSRGAEDERVLNSQLGASDD